MFDIYDVSAYAPEDALTKASSEDIVESGLSSGELRQALMDRFREELRIDNPYFLNINLKRFGLPEVLEEDLGDDDYERSVAMDIENFIYDLPDEDIVKFVWEFSSESIIVRGEDG